MISENEVRCKHSVNPVFIFVFNDVIFVHKKDVDIKTV